MMWTRRPTASTWPTKLIEVAALGHQGAGGAAEGAYQGLLLKAGKALYPDPVSPHDPATALGQARILDVGVGRLLEPARDRVEAHPPGGVRVGDARPDVPLEHPAGVRKRDQLIELLDLGGTHVAAIVGMTVAAASSRSNGAGLRRYSPAGCRAT